MADLILFERSDSPFCGAVRAALAEKNLPYTPRHVDGTPATTHDLETHNPLAKVPVLLHGAHAIGESLAILEYLEDTFPDPPLRPRDLPQRAQMRQAMSWLLSDGAARVAIVGSLSRQGALTPKAGMLLEEKTRQFHAAVDRFLEGKDYLAGSFSLADVLTMGFIGPTSFLGAAIHPSLKNLSAYRDRLRERPSFQKASLHEVDWPGA